MPFRGTSSHIGEPDNGTFLGILYLISSYYPTLKEMQHQQRGERVQSHYLSWQTQNEVISLCAKQLHQAILLDLQPVYYFGLIVDGTPNSSHTEHYTFVLRYALLKDRSWDVVERVLTSRTCDKKRGENIAKAICDVLEEKHIDIQRCCGQGYDNGSTMSGRYKGAQAVIHQKNPQALYAPCGTHSLNLCGVHAAEVSSQVKKFVGNIQKLYNLFAASTAHWKLLQETAGVTLHSLSQTRQSARIDALKALTKQYGQILEAFEKLKTDLDLPYEAFSDVDNMTEVMDSFEFVLLAAIWFKTLQCIDDVNKRLQYADISIADEVKHLADLQKEIQTLRDSWDSILDDSKALASSLGLNDNVKRNGSCTRKQVDNGRSSSSECISDEERAFKIEVYYAALDTLLMQLRDRFQAVQAIAQLFEFIINPPNDPSAVTIKEQAKHLVDHYPNDLVLDDLEDELQHYTKFHHSIGMVKNRAISILKSIYKRKIESLYPQICVCLQIFLAIPISVAAGECSFSKLAHIKHHLRSFLSQERLSSLMTLSIEHKLAKQISYEKLIDAFAAEKARKINL